MSGRILSTASATASVLRTRRARNLLVAILVPLLVAAAYLAGMSGADARSSAIPALIVNDDQMVTQTGVDGAQTPVVAGRLVVTDLTRPDRKDGFAWGLADAETAAQALENGTAYVVVTIPEEFSAAVVSLGGGDPRAAQLRVTTDQSHDYLSPVAAQALTDAMTAQFGTQITKLVAIGLFEGLEQTGIALQQAADGAGALADGADQLGSGFAEYTAGQQQITDGLAQTATGAGSLSSGIDQYTGGVDQLASGIGAYTDGVGQLASGIDQYTGGVDQLAAGLQELDAGGQQIRDAGQQLGDAAGQLSQYTDGITQAVDVYTNEVRPRLTEVGDASAQLAAFCEQLPDEQQAADCAAQIAVLDEATGGLDGVIGQVDDAVAQAGQLETGIAGLGQLADGLVQLADGISQASDGADQLSAGSAALRDGAGQLVTGGAELDSGAQQLAAGSAPLRTGAADLASGLGQLSDGQQQLVAGNAPIADGISQLATGARQLSDGLQTGADRADEAVGDPQEYGDLVAHPVVSEVSAQHDPGFGGMLVATVLPIAVWLAGLATMLARRLLTPGSLATTATNGRLLAGAFRRTAAPVAIVAGVLTLAAHVLLGVPWLAIVGTAVFAGLMALAVVGIHLLLVALWGRRMGAIASIALLAIQLVALRGFVPLELKSPFVSAIAGLFPATHAANGLQLVYAGGAFGGVAAAAAGLVLIAAVAFGATRLVVGSRRRVRLRSLVNEAEAGRSAAADAVDAPRGRGDAAGAPPRAGGTAATA